MSHPLRVRGLKPASSHGFMQDYQVASFTGAWIETMNKYTCIEKKYVASFTGAWIETDSSNREKNERSVASFTGAWIETSLYGGSHHNNRLVASFTGAWIETWTQKRDVGL